MPRRLKYQVGSNLFTVAWDKTQEYLDSCNRKIPSGGRDTYGKTDPFLSESGKALTYFKLHQKIMKMNEFHLQISPPLSSGKALL